MKNRRGAEKRRCQRHKTLDETPGLVLVGTQSALEFFSFASYRNAVVHLGSALVSILLQV